MGSLARVVRRPAVICVALLVGLGAWMFSAALTTSKVLGGDDDLLFQAPFQKPADLTRPGNPLLYDAVYVFHPDMQVAREDLRRGILPSWTPYQGAGQPLLASQQHAMLYPVNLLASAGPFWQSLEWLALIKLVLAAVGTLVLLRLLGLRWEAALLGGMSFGFSAFLVNWLEHPHANMYVLIPWILAATERLLRDGRPRDALLVGTAVGAAALGGHPPTLVIAILPSALWLVWRLALERPGVAHALRRGGLFAGGIAVGAALGAVMLIPFFEATGQAAVQTRSSGPGPRQMIFGFFAPELWGRPDKFQIQGGPINYLERTAYFGALPLVLAIGGLTARLTRPQVFFAVLAVLAGGMAIDVPGYSAWVADLPVFDRLNRTRMLVVVAFCGAVLAAWGLHHLLEAPRLRRMVLLGAAAGAMLLPLTWLLVHADARAALDEALRQMPNIQSETLPRPVLQAGTFVRWTLFAGVGLGALALCLARPRPAAVGVAVALAVVAVDVVTFNRGFHPAIPQTWAERPEPQAITYLRGVAPHQRIAATWELPPNTAGPYRLRDARGHNHPDVGRRYELWQALGGIGSPDFASLDASGASRIANHFAASHLISYDLEGRSSRRWPARGPHPVVANPEAFPRAFVAYGWRAAAGKDEALGLVKGAPDQRSLARPVIEGVAAGGAERLPATPARFLEDSDREVVLEARAARPGWLVLLDTWYPGWKATVDGRPTEIRHANVAFRAVRVPAGRHEVRFAYRPASVRIGAAVSLLALLGIAAGLALPAVRRRRGLSP